SAFTEVAHGSSLVSFYSYGPHHENPANEAASYRQELYAPLKRFNYAVGGAEEYLVNTRPIPSKVALLYSQSTDIWDLADPRRSISQAEQIGLYLLLTHLGYPIDILTEEDVLAGLANSYEAVFVTGTHLKTRQMHQSDPAPGSVVETLVTWAKAGGFLYLGPG